MDVSVILCTYNRCQLLGKSLESFQRQIAPPDVNWELLVVDNNCSDSTPELLREAARNFAGRLRFVREEKQGLSHARNRGIREARGQYLLFTDDDTEPASTWIAEVWKTFTARNCDAVAGKIELQWSCAKPSWMADELLAFLAKVDYGTEEHTLETVERPPIGANMAFRASVFDQIGNFDVELGRKGKALVGGEEIDFFERFLKQGLRALYQPKAVIYHSVDHDRVHKWYFRMLHFNNGKVSGLRYNGVGRQLAGIPLFIFPQTGRMFARYLRTAWEEGVVNSLRQEMNVWYSLGFITGCARRTSSVATKAS
jgi:glycosyltransferase involved in cell wall biosynthesis